MTTKKFETIDGNEAAARVAYQLNEGIALFPITRQNDTATNRSIFGAEVMMFRRRL